MTEEPCGEQWYEYTKRGTRHICMKPKGHLDKCVCKHCGLTRGDTDSDIHCAECDRDKEVCICGSDKAYEEGREREP